MIALLATALLLLPLALIALCVKYCTKSSPKIDGLIKKERKTTFRKGVVFPR